MIQLFNYLIISSLVLAVWYGVYRLVFAKSSFHGWNRMYLLMGLVFSVLTPFIPEYVTIQAASSELLSPVFVGVHQSPTSTTGSIGASELYWIITLIICVRLLIGVINITRLKSGGSFSFFGKINVEEGLTPLQEAQVLAHEKAHRTLGHSFDVIIIELYKAVHWINPIAWMYASSLKKVHEFQADQRVAQLGVDLHEYSVLLLSRTLKLQPSALLNRFHQPSILKQRIIMLTTKSRNTHKYLYLLTLPVLAGALLFSSCSKNALDEENMKVEAALNPDKKAEFPGGMDAMFEWIGSNLQYPEHLKESGIEGKVIVQFMVQADGTVDTFSVKAGLHPELDEITVKVLSQMPNWVPATKGSKPIAQEMLLPVVYKLD